MTEMHPHTLYTLAKLHQKDLLKQAQARHLLRELAGNGGAPRPARAAAGPGRGIFGGRSRLRPRRAAGT